jgi:hypothetical protein
MSMTAIQEVKARIAAIDRQMIELQAQRFSASLYLSVLLAQDARANHDPGSSEAEVRS